MSDVVYKADLDDKEVLEALKRIDKNIERIADRGDKAFAGVEKSAKRSGVQIGAVSGIVQEITRRFIDLGIKGAKALAALAAKGVELNREAERVRISLTAIFEGNERAAQAFLELVDETAIKLRTDQAEFRSLAKSILPDVGDIQTTLDLIERVTIFGKDAGQSFVSIRIAIEEALGGNLSSLQRRLNIPPAAIDSIKALQDELGLAGAIAKVLGDRIEDAGLSADLFADTLDAKFGLIQSKGRQLLQTFSLPVFEELKEQADGFIEIIEDSDVDLTRIAKAFGDLAAKATELFGGAIRELLENLDADEIEEIADNFTEMLDSAQLLADILTDPNLLNGILSGTNAILDALNRALITAAQLAAITKAENARVAAEQAKLQELHPTPEVFGQPLGGLFILSAQEETEVATAGQEAYNEVIRDAIKAFDDYGDRLDDNTQKQADRGKEVEKASKEDLDAANAVIQHKRALEELARASAEAEEAQKKINEEQAEFAREFQQELTDIQIDAERDRIDDAIKNAQKREDIARDNAQKIEDIFRDNAQEIEDAATDLARDEQDIARKAARDRQSVERDLANNRIDIERDFRQELLRIQQQFNQDAEEAERNNDAQAFLRAVRAKDAQIEQAQTRRDENIDQAKIEGERRREELRRQLEFEIEDAKIANRRKLEDLQISLQRELDEQQIKLEREIEEQRIAEERQAAERQISLQRELDDFARANAIKREDLQRSLETELKLVQEFENAKADVAIAEARRAAETIRKIRESVAGLLGGSSANTQQSGPFPVHLPLITRQHGGPVGAGQPAIVGERGPEVFVPDQAGTIIPNVQLFRPPVQSPTVQQITQQATTNAPVFNLAESMFRDPVARQQLRNFVLEVLGEV